MPIMRINHKEVIAMQIKLGKFSAEVPAVLLVIGAIIADNMYVNHCKVKSYEKAVNALVQSQNEEDEEES